MKYKPQYTVSVLINVLFVLYFLYIFGVYFAGWYSRRNIPITFLAFCLFKFLFKAVFSSKCNIHFYFAAAAV